MGFVTFGLEQWQSEHEQEVAYELADSGVQPVTWRGPSGWASTSRRC